MALCKGQVWAREQPVSSCSSPYYTTSHGFTHGVCLSITALPWLSGGSIKNPITPAAVIPANPKTLQVPQLPYQTPAQALAGASLLPAFNAATVIDAYQPNLMGDEVEMTALVEALQETTDKTKAGDLSTLEAMLIGQATALQTIFTSLAKRAQRQEYQKNLEAFLGLALKAQAQSRATISALVELKYPRHALFVKQANIAQGPQQVNNGQAPTEGNTHKDRPEYPFAEPFKSPHNELLEEAPDGRTQMDPGATTAAERSDSKVETVGTIEWTKKRRR